MLFVVSPAKTQDFSTPAATTQYTQARQLVQSQTLIDVLKSKSPTEIAQLMSMSSQLAELNHQRFQNFSMPFAPDNAKQALLAFKGDVYHGIDTTTLSLADFAFAQR